MNAFFGFFYRKWRRWQRKSGVTKRQLFVVITTLLTLGLVLTQLASGELRYLLVAALSTLTYLLSAFALREELHGIEWMTLLTLPTLYTAAIALFYFLLPVRWLTRLPVAALYALGMYALLLTENIYNVAAERTIALVRAAYSVGFLMTLVTFFLLAQTILAFRLPAILNVFAFLTVGFLLIFQSLWSMELAGSTSGRVWRLAIALSVVLGQLAWAFSFIPVPSTLIALFYTTCLYGIVGMGQQYLVDRLYRKTVVEFFAVSAIVFFIVMLTVNWRGTI